MTIGSEGQVVMGRDGCVLLIDGVKNDLIYHNAMRILRWEGQDELQGFCKGHYN